MPRISPPFHRPRPLLAWRVRVRVRVRVRDLNIFVVREACRFP